MLDRLTQLIVRDVSTKDAHVLIRPIRQNMRDEVKGIIERPRRLLEPHGMARGGLQFRGVR